ncbi:hypothetical protein ACWKWC_00570 [Geodermatophilus nigrescens]
MALISRSELAWVADTLARDFVRQISDFPGGHETLTLTSPGHYQVGWSDGPEPEWARRYPGW